MPINKFFYLAFTDCESENHVTIIRDSYPKLKFQLPIDNNKWMEPIVSQFFKNRAIVEFLKPSKNPNIFYESKEINFNFEFKKAKQVKNEQENKEKLFLKRLEVLFEHNEIILQPHQQRALDKLWRSKGELIFNTDDDKKINESFCWEHSTGSGKSYGSLSVFSKIPVDKVFILCSNAALLQWASYVSKMSQPKKSKTVFEIIGLTEFANLLANEDGGDMDILKNQFVIFDEAHVFRNLTSIMRLQIDALRRARFLQTLTATLTVNHISDIIGLCEIHGGELSKIEIESLKNTETPPSESMVADILIRCFSGRIDYYDAKQDAKNAKFYAPITIVIKEVPMCWEQTVDYMVRKRNNFQIGNLCVTTSARNSYRKNEKQISNSSNDHSLSPKFDLCCETITKFNHFPQIIYSNYLDNGIKGVYSRLKRKREDLKVDIATGVTKTSERESKRLAYNQGELDLLFLSKIGNASLDFAGSKALHLIDGFDNLSMEQQAIGRVSRFGAHAFEKDGTITPIIVFKYISTFPNFENISQQDKDLITNYFYKTYCNPNVGSRDELIPFDFVAEFIAKIKTEENNKTVDQQLEISNQYKSQTLEPANKIFRMLGGAMA